MHLTAIGAVLHQRRAEVVWIKVLEVARKIVVIIKLEHIHVYASSTCMYVQAAKICMHIAYHDLKKPCHPVDDYEQLLHQVLKLSWVNLGPFFYL